MSREKLSNFLRKRKIAAKIINTDVETPSVVASSEALDLSRKKILKTIIFQSDTDIVAALARGDQRVNENKLAKLIDAKKIGLAKPNVVRRTTGYDVGGVPPVGHDNQDDIVYVMDKKLLESDEVYAGGGDERSQLNIKVNDILRLVDPKIADISK